MSKDIVSFTLMAHCLGVCGKTYDAASAAAAAVYFRVDNEVE